MSSPKTPPPPDYAGLANQQSNIDREAMLQETIANRPTQENPFGKIEWKMDPETGQWTQKETYDPRLQGLADASLDTQAKMQERVKGLANGPGWQTTPGAELFNPSDFGFGQFNPTNLNMEQYLGGGQIGQYGGQNQIGQFDQQANDEYANRFTESLLARVRPQQQVDQRAMETRLRLQGLQPGTEAYDRAYQNLLTSQGDVTAQAQLQGQLAGGQEGRNMYQTMLQGQMARGSEGRADYASLLQGQMARGAEGRADYNTQLESALSRGEYDRKNYQTDFEAKMRQADLERQNYAAKMQGQGQMNDQSMEQYLQQYKDVENIQGLANAYNQFRPGYQTFTSARGTPGADMMGAAQQQYAQQVQAANDAYARKQQQGSMWGSVVGGAVGGYFGGPAGASAGASAGGAAGSYFSDEALKENITQISDEDAFLALQKVHPYSFTWPNGSRGGGLIAQEVQKVFPHLVEEDTGYLKVDYEGFTALLLGAFRHLAKENSRG